MAQIFPNIEQIGRLKEAPTTGELELLYYLKDHLPEEYEVYFQPYFNGLRPDIVLMRRGWGVIIIEVKDWNLNLYEVDEKNNWILSQKNAKLRSPFQQVFGYKKSMFDLHINGLAEQKLLKPGVYNILKPFVYFHGSSRDDVNRIFAPAEQIVKTKRDELNVKIKNERISQFDYDKQMDYLENKSRQINRDRGLALHKQKLKVLHTVLCKNALFTDEIYEEFTRYLQPPFHTKEQGKAINYGVLQRRLSKSAPGFQKIKGVAGSGKTTVLAKRAVDAHKRHNDRVLLLTFNLTLKNYIHDKISDVREDFSWGVFDIINYHSFIGAARGKAGVPNPIYNQDFYEEFYSNETMFDGFSDDIHKYKTILIDEIQDFTRPWISIIKKYFLEPNGEMILFGDEGQNIYERDINKSNPEIIRGFGKWERLTKSYRSKDDSKLTQLISAFQTEFLSSKYDIDTIDKAEPESEFLSLDILQNHTVGPNINWNELADFIFSFIKKNKIHPNDICIFATEIAGLRQLDQAYRHTSNEQTNTTFESQEAYEAQIEIIEEQFKRHAVELRKQYPGKSDENVKKAVLESNLKEIRRSKKYHFWRNPGTLKLSTVHSFKGLEEQNIIYILDNRDTVEIIYTAVTRSRRNLLTFMPKSTGFSEFFESHLDTGIDF